ncbi:helix-turn-helix domain-containing protein [Pseudidiomarina terrestris]|uniref:Helix-turn-helix transcriptional regulator n=1 Tax=Pseudidiomarina terrestris TaxID=2820060 RepID=A0AAW7QX94_9GAMM|nr:MULTISPECIES: helix-turn-helix transcriptional regulator [unclassified Pseudidiomarina]MDN7124498.1 helix-turn-helix transcriptional regulator [Pseudidiomarina sp. 1APP75-32.1]MDN7129211.1 helix-turn-helix transcriptional regulator [Pseudidiomarina sp. 1APR75-15]MDN7134523.1 helix-turn-helix transcriptional regulator [Pseudidiomarina sp. 1ASP75-5]
MKTIDDVANMLATERKKRNLTQTDMRMLIGMSQQQYQRVEAGQDMRLSTLLRILAGLGLELEFADPMQPSPENTDTSAEEPEDFWSHHQQHLKDD